MTVAALHRLRSVLTCLLLDTSDGEVAAWAMGQLRAVLSARRGRGE